jgi:DMSO reductase anchor subunit
MWRAVLNVRRSWLSREIALFGAFSGAAVFHLLLPDLPGVKAAAAVLGAATLFSMDRVYDLVRSSRFRLHSADTVLTGALVACLLGGAAAAAVGVAGVKGLLYVADVRRGRARIEGGAAHGVRLAGLVLAAAAAGFGSGSLPVWVWLLLVPAEVIDRVRFYRELRVVSPHRQTAADLALARSSSK